MEVGNNVEEFFAKLSESMYGNEQMKQKIEIACHLLKSTHNKNLILVGKPGDGKMYSIIHEAKLACLNVAVEDITIGRDVLNKMATDGITGNIVAFDEVDRIPDGLLLPFKMMLENKTFCKLIITNDIGSVNPAIIARCLIFNLHN